MLDDTKTGREVDDSTKQERRLCCAACATPVGSRDDAWSPDGGPVERVFFNPAGIVMKVVTLATASNLALVSDPTDEFTWFDGFAWRIAVCGGCGLHLGWRFQPAAGAGATFWGLLVERLREG